MNTLQQHVDTIADFTNREQLIDYLMYIADELPSMKRENIVRNNHVRGCKNNIWITCQTENDTHYYNFHSDSKVVRGICKIFYDVYNGKTTAQITATNYYDFKDIASHMTGDRQKGMQAIINRIHKLAKVT